MTLVVLDTIIVLAYLLTYRTLYNWLSVINNTSTTEPVRTSVIELVSYVACRGRIEACLTGKQSILQWKPDIIDRDYHFKTTVHGIVYTPHNITRPTQHTSLTISRFVCLKSHATWYIIILLLLCEAPTQQTSMPTSSQTTMQKLQDEKKFSLLTV